MNSSVLWLDCNCPNYRPVTLASGVQFYSSNLYFDELVQNYFVTPVG